MNQGYQQSFRGNQRAFRGNHFNARVVEVTIEVVVADIFKTFTGMLVEALLGQVVDSTLETSRRNTLLPTALPATTRVSREHSPVQWPE